MTWKKVRERLQTQIFSRIDFSLYTELNASFLTCMLGLPLAVGTTLTFGVPLSAGLVAAVVGGLCCGVLSGIPLQVTGPAVTVTVIAAQFVDITNPAQLAAVVCGAGLCQLIFAGLGLYRLVFYIDRSVVDGLLLGVGLTVMLAQLHIIGGGAPSNSAWLNALQLPHLTTNLNITSVLVALLTWCAVGLMRLTKLGRVVPVALLGVVFGTWLAWFFELDLARLNIPSQLFTMTGGLLLSTALPYTKIACAAMGVAIIGTMYSLLSALSIDIAYANRPRALARELIAQGLGNLCSGLLGGLPMAAAITRTTANVAAGAKTRLATMLQGLWTWFLVLLLGSLLKQIPVTCLSVLFLELGFRLIDLRKIKQAYQNRTILAYVATVGCCLGVNLLVGVVVGSSIALLLTGKTPAVDKAC